MPFGDDDLDVFVGQEFRSAVVIGATTYDGIWDRAGIPVLDGNGYAIQATRPSVRMKTSDVSGADLDDGDSLTVGGVSYTVGGAPELLGPDGVWMRVWLQEA